MNQLQRWLKRPGSHVCPSMFFRRLTKGPQLPLPLQPLALIHLVVAVTRLLAAAVIVPTVMGVALPTGRRSQSRWRG